MNEHESVKRAAVVTEAQSWLRTPYHHRGRLKGVGADCAQLPAAVYAACGLIPEPPLDDYPRDWHLHRSAERYMERVTQYASEIFTDPLPGDFVLYRWGRCFAHGAIVVRWPHIIHAVIGEGVVLGDGTSGRLAGRQRKTFTLWGPEQ